MSDDLYFDKSCSIKFNFLECVTESRGQEIYDIKFCNLGSNFDAYFASVRGNCVSVYNVLNTSAKFELGLILAFADEDNEECFYCCAWASNESKEPIILCAGSRGVVKGINCISSEICVLLLGHGNSINSIMVHSLRGELCFTSSRDESIRLWNLMTSECIAIFAGDKGHRLDVLFVDMNFYGNCFLSAGESRKRVIFSLKFSDVQVWILPSKFGVWRSLGSSS